MKSSSIAIVGMAGRFPGARNTEEFWENLRKGVESVRDFSQKELLAAGATAEDLANPDYVRRGAVLNGVALFDASFFGLSPRDAAIMDPQHRHFVECAWEALEDAAHPPQQFSGSIGVFAGSGMNTYLIHNLLANRRLAATAGLFQLKQTGNDKDLLATRVSYQLDLRGPSINVQTACSTSLVAVHLACQSLLNCECDMALAGGVTIEFPHGLGYVYREGEILSRDGHCRPFDADSSGTIFSSGLGIVVLRRLEDALADRDHIRAVILGTAINNDGARKVGYLAPSVEGQAEVIREALDFAGVPSSSISYVETHGTGTRVGDPIELRALSKAFHDSAARGATAIGSLKSNIGHLDAAAGVAGLIKTVLALEREQIPASLHFTKLNPHIELSGSPFYVNSKLADWPANGTPRRAGVTSLGIGGTNAHVVLQEAPKALIARQPRPHQVLIASAKSADAADQAIANLAAHLADHSGLNLADAAFTSQLGRTAFAHRRAFVVEDEPESIAALSGLDARKLIAGTAGRPELAFLFPGQGSQYVNMGRELYQQERVFRETLDFCSQQLREALGIDLVAALYPPEQEKKAAAERLNETWLTQPALFAVEYALARWWISLGVGPAAMAGHSVGEYVAACLAGVFSLEDALSIVATRGRLIYYLPDGAMVAVPLAPSELPINGKLSVAAINNPRLCVVSGPKQEIARLEALLAGHSVACHRLFTSHAFHSAMMDPILGAFEETIRTIRFHEPRIPYLSNVTGTWIKAEEAVDPAYWVRHIRSTVRFSDNLAELLSLPERVMVEAGPGNVLSTLARQQGGASARAIPSLPHAREAVPALHRALEAAGRLWTLGANIDWARLHAAGSVQRIPLPTYPFERQKYWIDAGAMELGKAQPANAVAAAPVRESAKQGIALYRRTWKPAPLAGPVESAPGTWLVFRDSLGIAERIAAQLQFSGQEVIVAEPGESFGRLDGGRYTLRPAVRADYDALIADLTASGRAPRKIVHLWSLAVESEQPRLEETLDRCFYSPLFLAQALSVRVHEKLQIALVSNRLQQVAAEPVGDPARAVLFGPARALHKELPGFACKAIDLDLDEGNAAACAAHLITEIDAAGENSTVAWRYGQRFVEALDPYQLDEAPELRRLEHGGVYLITGGLGALGLTVAEHLAREFEARLVLLSRSGFPPEQEWEQALEDVTRPEAEKDRLRKLKEIRSLASGLLVLQADVTHRGQMQAAVARARSQFGKIDGVFHTAGVLDDSLLMLKNAEGAARVLDPKVRGTLILEEVLRGEALTCFVLFSSISSIMPPAGQVDYAAANAFLDTYALSRSGPVTVINWGAWREVGMAARASSPHPWLQERLLNTPDAIVYAGRFSQQRRWVLSEHRLRNGIALIPGTGHLEMAAEAFTHGSLQGAVEFRDVFFLSPLTIAPGESREVRVQLRREQDAEARKGAFRFSVFAGNGAWREHATGAIGSCRPYAGPAVDRVAILARCGEREIVFDEQNRTRQERQFEFGPRWRSLRRLHLGKAEGLAEIELDLRFAADVATLRQHPALLDMATGAALYLTWDYDHCQDLFLPIAYRRMSVYRNFPARMYSHIRARHDTHQRSGVESFDITIFDEQNQVLAEIEGFAVRRIADAAKLIEDAARTHESAGSGEQPIAIASRPGIAPADGARILTRILLAATPAAIVVLPEPLEELQEPAKSEVARGADEPVAAPPPAVAPVEEEGWESIEATLTGWWQELLGVDEVLWDDDFFALGGHSLVGVRLFAKIKKTFQVDLDLAVLFEARTVRALAEVIRKWGAPQSREPRIWSALVPVQSNGSQVPLFCVHAVGGDVLFYEQLSKALGPDQPFYAFQSPLVAEPGRRDVTVEEMASLYVREMRDFFPQGPYLLGAASYGGFVLYEMARQLHEQGIVPAAIILFDVDVPGSGEFFGFRTKLAKFWANVRSGKLHYLGKKVGEKSAYFWTLFIEKVVLPAGVRCCRLLRRPLSATLRFNAVAKGHWGALAHYTFRPFPGKITLIRASDRGPEVLGRREDPTLGWGGLAEGGVDVIDVPTRHMVMLFDPYVETFAGTLKSILSASLLPESERSEEAALATSGVEDHE